MILYHGTDKNGLLTLEPFLSEHDERYVYLSSNKVVAAFYTVHIVSRPYNYFTYGFESEIPVYTEYFKNSLKEIYGGKCGYIYQCEMLDKSDNPTDISCAYTSALPIETLGAEAIGDMYEWFLQKEKSGELIIKKYEDLSEKELENIDNMMAQEIIKYDLHNKNCDYSQFISNHFPTVWKNTNNN